MDQLNMGDTAWVLVSTALVMFMTPGLALFYGGMVRKKNVLSTIMQSFIILGVVSVQWALFGYSLSFAPDAGGGLIGGLDFLGLANVGMEPDPNYAATIPHLAFMIFQMMFAVITPALITGAFAERFKFKTFLVFTLLWCTVVYDPIAHWVWGPGGWIREMGALDFAGGTVVHISSGIAALAAALVVGKRRNYLKEPMFPHNITMTVIGASILWFGWFGFNAGSALAANGLAASAFVTTHLAAAAAAVSWTLVEWMYHKKPTVLGAASGAVAGLVAITPGAGFVTPMSSIIIGLIGGVLCFIAVNLKPKLGYDDSLDVVGVHFVGGTFGALATGLFATTMVNSAGADGLFYGNAALLGKQAVAVGVTMVYSFVVSIVILKVLDLVMGLRVEKDDELRGLDQTQHGESGYIFD
ncbi:MAG: ammonium transporter [Nitrospirae bacterium]|nr:ammonium transporter [Nitrospirota bacterium]MBI5695765.1 ammonium transporter [Nitrospirota bacterium]